MRSLLDINVVIALFDSDHEFWPDSVSFLDRAVIDTEKVFGPRQITGLYLLALAASHGGCLVTFDCSIHGGAVLSATENTLLTI